jgi:HEPN domain-containing protein
MSIATETASEYYELARKAAERGDVRNALYYGEQAAELLLREPIQTETRDDERAIRAA